MALRNLSRNRRRTLSTLLAIAVGLVGLTLLDGYVTYSMDGLREDVIHSGTGHIQVARSPEFFDEGDDDPFPFMLDNEAAVEKELRGMAEVKDVVPALSFLAVLDCGGKNSTVMVTALPVGQAAENLDSRHIAAGADLVPGDSGRILVGRGLAKKLGIAPGKAVSLFALGKGGGVKTLSYSVKGTTSTIIAAIDNVSVFMDLSEAKALVGADTVPQLLVFLRKTKDSSPVMARLDAEPTGSPAAGLTFRSWEELSPYYRQASTVYQMVLSVSRLIVLIVALFSISGTLSLAILERLREIGTLRAFGTKRRQIVLMFLLEGLCLGILGAAVGGIAGMGLAGLINLLGGFSMPPQPGMTQAFVIRFTPDLVDSLQNVLWAITASVVGAFVPAALSSRRVIAGLLRSN
jgi:putative ABC transport system permease protein